jgi:hypothetical protein
MAKVCEHGFRPHGALFGSGNLSETITEAGVTVAKPR